MGNINSCGVSPKQVNNAAYTGSSLSLIPVINLQHNPQTRDRNFPLFTFARNGNENDADFGSIWYLQKFEGVTGDNSDAIWVRLSSGAGPALEFAVPAGTSPVVPDSNGLVTYTSTGGTIAITGGLNEINFDLAGGGVAVDSFTVPLGTSPVVPNSLGNIAITTGPGVTVTGGLNTYQIALTGGGIAVDSFAVPHGTTPVVPDANGLITLTEGGGVTITGGLNTYSVALTGGGIATQSFDVDAHTAPGTDPVVPTALGVITLTGAQVASGVVGANVIRTDSLAANSITWEIQQGGTAASPDTTLNGVLHADSAIFTAVNGFLTVPYTPIGFTPVLAFGGASVGITYSTQLGRYWKIGNLVNFTISIILTNKGSSTGVATISVPFSPGTNNGNNFSLFTSLITFDSGYTYCGGTLPSGNAVSLVQFGSGVASLTLTNTNFANNSMLVMSGFYGV